MTRGKLIWHIACQDFRCEASSVIMHGKCFTPFVIVSRVNRREVMTILVLKKVEKREIMEDGTVSQIHQIISRYCFSYF
jgi:hypothetical protein